MLNTFLILTASVLLPTALTATDGAMPESDELSVYDSYDVSAPLDYAVADGYPDNNPLFDSADPDIILVDNRVYVYNTSKPNGQFYAHSSVDLVNWYKYGPVLNFANIGWIPHDKTRYGWAPGIIKRNNIYYFYYAVGPKPAYIGVAWSTSPNGVFNDSGNYLVADNNEAGFEAIDPMAFKDPVSGKYYLYAGGSNGASLRVWELNDDMMSLARQVPVNRPSYFTEGAYMHYRNGIYYMSYSNGGWQINDGYNVRYSTSSSPTGPWTYRGKILEGNDIYKSPGHHSILYNARTDEWLIFYHRWDPIDYSKRWTAVEKLYYLPDGRIQPIVMTDRGVGPIPLGRYLASDFNKDGSVNMPDLETFYTHWLAVVVGDIAPLYGDGFVDMLDYELFSRQWARSTVF